MLTSENDVDTDCVLIDVFHSPLGVQSVVALLRNGNEAHFNLEVARKLLERNLSIGTHDDVRAWFVDGLASGLALLLPDTLHEIGRAHV